MDSRRADVGESQSGQPPQRKLRLLHQSTPADAKTWPANAAVMLSGNNAKHRAATIQRPRQSNPRKTTPGIPISCETWLLTNGSRAADQALRTLTGGAHAARALPAAGEADLTPQERQLSGALLRVDHVGEVCAQALYQAQVLPRDHRSCVQQMKRAAAEEVDHLAWTERRLAQLGARTSLLNPLWYAGAFGIGLLARLGGRPLEPGLRGRDRAPGGAAPRRSPRCACRAPTRLRARSSSR